jgi:crotonobetainyl-CoA:carnitine CoA-transferase CaiB-like acyl-CoA transferase
MTMPLSGVRILDLGRTFAAPICTQMLADLGAEVLKVERLGRGDELRYYGPPFTQDEHGRDEPVSAYFLSANRNKKSLALDFTTAEGQAVIRDLASKSDICVENYKVGDLVRYGLDYASLSAVNPALIYCSITGFGQTGPYAKRPATDSVFQSMSGLMSVTGEPDGPPQKVGLVITDYITGLTAAIAIQAALRHREVNGGGGQHIDMALLDATVAAMSHRAVEHLMDGSIPQRMGTRTPGSAPAQTYACADGEINFQASAEPKFKVLCDLLGCPELVSDPRFATRADRVRNIDDLQVALEEKTKSWKSRDLYEALIAVGIICSPVYTMDQTFTDPQIQHRELAKRVPTPDGRSVPMVRNPIRFSRSPIERYDPPPAAIGQDDDMILRGVLGYDDTRITALRAAGAIG